MIYDLVKRLIDFVGAFFGILLFSPILIAAALAVRLNSPGPIFYIHERVGRGGKGFMLIKFRSMYQEFCTGGKYNGLSDEAYIKNVLKDKAKLAEFQKYSKMMEDPRVTKVGRFIRKTSIDEMPQFWNVLKGEMSLVGPRAFRAHELNRQIDLNPQIKPFVKKALSAKPGISGPWQVGGRSKVSFEKRIAIDAEYADQRSILYDIWIIIKTPFAVIHQEGAA